jgi:ubiquinone/menaquinone biosynthesis C-methylase UbiE
MPSWTNTPGGTEEVSVADACFAEPRLAGIYDALDADRSDLGAYLGIVEEFAARSVLDIGCGTGTFACLLARRGVRVVGLDPAAASLEVAGRKPGAGNVSWIHGDISALPPLDVDMVTMTGNVAQVFVADDEWAAVLAASRRAVGPAGVLVFETRDLAREAWHGWTRQRTERRVQIPGVGAVRTWTELTHVALPLVSFRATYVFEADSSVLTSESTLRFWQRDEIERSLRTAGFAVQEVRDAPDRPGLEMVFLARPADTAGSQPQPVGRVRFESVGRDAHRLGPTVVQAPARGPAPCTPVAPIVCLRQTRNGVPLVVLETKVVAHCISLLTQPIGRICAVHVDPYPSKSSRLAGSAIGDTLSPS